MLVAAVDRPWAAQGSTPQRPSTATEPCRLHFNGRRACWGLEVHVMFVPGWVEPRSWYYVTRAQRLLTTAP